MLYGSFINGIPLLGVLAIKAYKAWNKWARVTNFPRIVWCCKDIE